MYVTSFYLNADAAPCDLHSFPTRRSSDLQDLKRSDWRKLVAYVPQMPQLVFGTVRENIRFFRDDLTDEDVILAAQDRKSTRLNSSHVAISYAVFCLKKKRDESGEKAAHAV